MLEIPNLENEYVREFSLIEYPNLDYINNIFRHDLIYENDKKTLRNYCETVTSGSFTDRVVISYGMK